MAYARGGNPRPSFKTPITWNRPELSVLIFKITWGISVRFSPYSSHQRLNFSLFRHLTYCKLKKRLCIHGFLFIFSVICKSRQARKL
jgi:hypothetical protein